MGIVIRQSIKSTIVTYFGLIIGYFTTLWLMPYCLSPEEVGLVRIILNLAMLFAAFAHVGMTNIVSKYYNYFKDTKNQDSFAFQILFVPLVGAAIFTLLYVGLKSQFAGYFEEKSSLLVEYYWYILPFTIIVTFFNVLVSYSRSLMRSTFPALLKEVLFRIALGVLIISFFFNWLALDHLVMGMIITYVVLTIILFAYTQVLRPQPIRVSFDVWKSSHAKEIKRFALYSMLHGASGILIINIDSIMLSGMTGLSNFGIYSIAFTISMVVEIPRRSISFTTFPVLAEAWKNNDIRKVKLFHQKASINQSLAGLLIFLMIWTNLDYFFEIMPNGSTYASSKWVVIIVGGGKIIELLAGMSGEVITGSKYFFYNLVFTSILVGVAIFTNWLLIPSWGIEGAATASCISIVAFTLAKTIFILIKFKIHPFTINLIKTLALALITLIVLYYLPTISNPYVGVVVNSIVCAVVFIPAAYFFKLSEEFNTLTNRFLKLKS